MFERFYFSSILMHFFVQNAHLIYELLISKDNHLFYFGKEAQILDFRIF